MEVFSILCYGLQSCHVWLKDVYAALEASGCHGQLRLTCVRMCKAQGAVLIRMELMQGKAQGPCMLLCSALLSVIVSYDQP